MVALIWLVLPRENQKAMNSECEFDPPDKHIVPAEASAKQEGN